MQPLLDWLGMDRHIGNMARRVIDTRDLLYWDAHYFMSARDAGDA